MGFLPGVACNEHDQTGIFVFVTRLSKTETSQSRSTKQGLQQKENVQNASPCRRVTRSQVAKPVILSSVSPCRRVTRLRAAASDRLSNASLKNASIDLAEGRIPLVEIGANERRSAEVQMEKEALQTKQVDLSLVVLDGESPVKRSKPLSKASFFVAQDSPEARITKQGREVCKLKIANVTMAKTTENKASRMPEEKSCAPQQESSPSKMECAPNSNGSPQTPTVPKANRQSVRRSLMGRTSVNRRASLMERYSLSSKREKMIQKSFRQSQSKRRVTRQSSLCRRISGKSLWLLVAFL